MTLICEDYLHVVKLRCLLAAPAVRVSDLSMRCADALQEARAASARALTDGVLLALLSGFQTL